MQYDAEEKLREIREILADPIIERECGSDDNFLWNVEQWAKLLIAAANESRMHPRTSDHTPERLRSLSVIAESLSHDVGGHFDDLQDICNILQDIADEREGVIFEPELATTAPQDGIVTVRLNANEWGAFQKALAEPPKPNERLQRLMTEPSVFDETPPYGTLILRRPIQMTVAARRFFSDERKSPRGVLKVMLTKLSLAAGSLFSLRRKSHD